MMNQKLIERIIDRYMEGTGEDYSTHLRMILKNELNGVGIISYFIEDIKKSYYVLPEQPTVAKDYLGKIIDSRNKFIIKPNQYDI